MNHSEIKRCPAGGKDRAFLRLKFCAAFLRACLLLMTSVSMANGQRPLVVPPPPALPKQVEVFKVKTHSEMNKEIPFYLRTPKNYLPGRPYRLLFLCPYLNQDGLEKLAKSPEWLALADLRGWFILTCTFKQPREAARDRKISYYYPESFSGRALLEALELSAKKYPLDTNRLLMQGLSGGGQFVHRFALWAPDRVTAVAINSSSWFDAPNDKCKRVAWLITIGEADPSYNASLDMVDRLRNAGAAPVFRSYIGMVHEGSPAVDRMDMEFLKYYDELTDKNLGKPQSALTTESERLALQGEKMPYVGDSQDWKFVPNTAEARDNIPDDSRIYLPSSGIARMWGEKEDPQ